MRAKSGVFQAKIKRRKANIPVIEVTFNGKQKFEMILSRQTPDAEKRKRADFVIVTDKGLDFARAQVQTIMNDLIGGS